MQDPDPKCRHFVISWHFMTFWHVCQKANCITKSAQDDDGNDDDYKPINNSPKLIYPQTYPQQGAQHNADRPAQAHNQGRDQLKGQQRLACIR